MRKRHQIRAARLVQLIVCWAIAVSPAPVANASPGIVIPVITEPVFEVSEFHILFDREVESVGLSDEELLNQPIELGLVNGVYTQPQDGAEPATVTLAELGGAESAATFDITALRAIIDDLLAYLIDNRGLIGVLLSPSPADIGPDNADLRDGRTDLTLIIRIASVGELRTLASGERIDEEEREDHPLHQSIRDRSPLQPGEEARGGTIIQRDVLDEYLYRLNRHPGRRVDAAISHVGPGEFTLDYLVAENRPWYVYFQFSNTGTPSTNRLRERFGYVNNQLTNNDDTFIIDYITAGFDDSHVVRMGYTRPLSEQWQVRFNGLWSTFNADQVGSPLAFTGEDAAVGAMLAYNFYQDGPFFIDAVGGLEYYYTSANNPGAATEGEANLLLATLGIELESRTDLAEHSGYLLFNGNLNQGNTADFATLGRTAPDTQFFVMQYGYAVSFYLEPLLNRAAWEDITTPGSSTLAHELAFMVRGQVALDNDRLVPTFQAIAGGLNTVRGYEQAEVAGDSSMIFTAEYRFHLPRVSDIAAPVEGWWTGQPFRAAPEAVYGRPDWDLIMRAFVDYAVMDVSNELAFETDETLMSTGVGVELTVRNNISLRADWGIALQDAGATQSGDSIVHFALTFVY